MTPTIHWPTNHSPITFPDPPDPPNPHPTWPFILLFTIWRFDVYEHICLLLMQNSHSLLLSISSPSLKSVFFFTVPEKSFSHYFLLLKSALFCMAICEKCSFYIFAVLEKWRLIPSMSPSHLSWRDWRVANASALDQKAVKTIAIIWQIETMTL